MRMKYTMRSSQHASGFTLMEIVISVAIVAIIAAVVLVNYRGAAQGQTLARTAHGISVELQQAQSRALGAELLSDGTIPSGGYGVYFDMNNPQAYVVFADRDGDQLYNFAVNPFDCAANIECMEVKRVGDGMVIEKLQAEVSGVYAPTDSLTVLFCAPYAVTLLYGEGDARGSGPCQAGPGARESVVTSLAAQGMVPSAGTIRHVRVFATGAVEVVNDNEL